MGEIIGYRRVSSKGQSLERQELLEVTGRIFEEKLSGANRDRPQLKEMIAYVRDGDEVQVHSIDRLARSLKDLQDIVEQIINKGASVHFLKEGLHFKPNQDADAFQTLMFQMLGAFSEFENALRANRQKEGIEKAKADGKYKGRKSKIDQTLIWDLNALGHSPDDIAKWLGIGRASVFRIKKELAETQELVYAAAEKVGPNVTTTILPSPQEIIDAYEEKGGPPLSKDVYERRDKINAVLYVNLPPNATTDIKRAKYLLNEGYSMEDTIRITGFSKEYIEWHLQNK